MQLYVLLDVLDSNFNVCACVCARPCVQCLHFSGYMYGINTVSNVPIFRIVLRLLKCKCNSSCILEMSFYFSVDCDFVRGEVCLLFYCWLMSWRAREGFHSITSDTIWQTPQLPEAHALRVTDPERLLYSALWIFDSYMSMLIKTRHTPLGCHRSVLEIVLCSYRNHGSDRKEGREKERKLWN